MPTSLDFGAPVAQNVNVSPQQGIQTISGILGLQQQQQQLQTQTAEAQLAQQKQQELQTAWQAIPQAVNDPSYQNTGPDGKPDGTLNTAKFQQLIAAKAPIFGAQYADQWLDAANAATENRSRILNLSNAQSQIVSDGLGAISQYQTNTGKPLTGPVLATLTSQLRARLGNDPDANALIDHFLGALPSTGTLPSAQASATNQAYVGRAKALIDQTRSGQQPGQQPPAGGPQTPTAPAQGQPGAPPPQGAPQGAPGAAPSPLDQMRLSAQIGGSTATAPQYAPYTGPDSKTHYAQVNPNAPGGQRADLGTTLPQGMSPSERYSVTALPNNQAAVVDRMTGKAQMLDAGGGAAAPPKVPPGTGPQRIGYQGGQPLTSDNDPQKPGANDPGWRQQTYGNAVLAAQKAVYAAQDQDTGYGTNMATADMIRNYSSNVNTGPGTAGWTRAMGLISSRFGGSSAVSNTQTLASFLDLQATRLREAMNLPPTNAGLATSQEMGTSIESQRSAIQAKTDYYQAMTELYHQYRIGLDAAGHGGANPSPTGVAQFKRAFASNGDPISVEIQLATQRGDTAAANKLWSSLSPQQQQQVKQHGAALARISQGQLPQ